MTCNDCNRDNPPCGFQVRKDRPKGFTSYCRDCLKSRWRKWAYGGRMNRATFHIPEPAANPDSIPFALTPKERDHAAWATVHLEKLRRERNRRDAVQAVAA